MQLIGVTAGGVGDRLDSGCVRQFSEMKAIARRTDVVVAQRGVRARLGQALVCMASLIILPNLGRHATFQPPDSRSASTYPV